MKAVLYLLLFSCFSWPLSTSGQSGEKETEFSLMAWNIWNGGKSSELGRDGVDDVIGIIKASEADIILMIETYGSGKRIADSLGYYFHLISPPGTALDEPSVNLSILSRFPFGDREDFYRYFNVGGVMVRLENGDQVVVFNTWLNFQPWHDQPHLMDKTSEELVEWEKSGTREKEVLTITRQLQLYTEKSHSLPVIVGGDFNVWSPLDWTAETSNSHGGKQVAWWTMSQFARIGLIDSFREVNPDPVESPGITWGLPGIDDDHRIDYLLYKSDRLKAIASEIHKADYNHPFSYRGQVFDFPSDHGFVWTKFKLTKE